MEQEARGKSRKQRMTSSILLAIPVLLFGVMFCFWIATAIKNHRLLNEFKRRMPKEAFAVLPEAFQAGRNPRKVWFFFSSEAARIMSADPQLSRMRVCFVRMAIASFIAPFAVFLVVALGLFALSKALNVGP